MIADAGGVALAGGRRMRTGVLFRVSGGLAGRQEIDRLRELGVRVYVDLRGEGEDRTALAEWARTDAVRYVHQPIDAGRPGVSGALLEAVASGGGREYLTGAYADIVSQGGRQIAAVLREVAAVQPAAFGCAAGKDRTGVVNACLQVLLGASEETATDFYLRTPPSPDTLRRLVESFELPDDEPTATQLDIVLGVDPAMIGAAFDQIRDGWGGVEAYLTAHGLEAEAVQGLRTSLVVPA